MQQLPDSHMVLTQLPRGDPQVVVACGIRAVAVEALPALLSKLLDARKRTRDRKQPEYLQKLLAAAQLCRAYGVSTARRC